MMEVKLLLYGSSEDMYRIEEKLQAEAEITEEDYNPYIFLDELDLDNSNIEEDV